MSLTCYHCHELGHLKADCPFLAPCGHDEHLSRIGHFVSEWVAGNITVYQKRSLISDENLLYYGPGCRRALIWP